MHTRPNFRVPAVLTALSRPLRAGRPAPELLHNLPPREQEALILSSYYHLATDEIAELLGVSIGVVETLLARGKEQLRRALTPPSIQAA